MKQIFIRFEANKSGLIRLFHIEAKTADFTCETNKNGIKYSLLSEYFTYFAQSK